MVKRYSIAEARKHLPEVVHEAEEGARVEITREGAPVAVILGISPGDEGRKSFWESYQEFRQTHDLDEDEIDPDEVFGNVRDRSPGRDPSW